jgi:hypothetical protein
MSARNELNSYVSQLERRLRLATVLRGAAILTSAALVATLLLVLIANAFAFSGWSVGSARFALLIALAAAAVFGIAFPLWRLSRKRAADDAEKVFPQFQQRLVTFADRAPDEREPFIELLAADTLEIARRSEPKLVAPNAKLLALLGGGLTSLAVLVWMIAAGPGYLGYGSALLWNGWHVKASPFYDIRVTPGDASVRRNADELVTAQPVGVQTDKVRLYARYHSASKWEQLTMQPQPGGSAFQFMFAGLPEGVEYYVEAGAVHSRHFNIRVVDLPAVKQIRVTYKFPSWTGLKDVVDEHGGDLRAVEGTQAALEVVTDRPMHDGVLMLDNGQKIQLTGGTNNHYSGAITMDKDGAYHIAAIDQGQPVRLSEDFFIAANKANPPEIQIVRPGRDYRASPIEEVTVSVKATDEFALNDLSLHYSVNGGPDQTASLLKQKGAKEADGSTTLYLENFKLVPGDLVSFYASAKDTHAESHTDIFFIQADPFEREFSQSQQGGGGGGGGQGNQNDISDREKEIIAATWKQQGNTSAASQQATEQGKFLSEVQSKLRDQAIALAGRLQLRDLTQETGGFSSFQKDMNAAAQAMNPAADKLHRQKWHDALPDEQKALQHLLQAEATFRQIQVAFGNQGGGGGGGASRDLASLFDLELDTQKNQYETAQTASSAANSREQQIDDALKKLDELARRQQELAQQRTNNGQTFDQRWQQEMLRREAEQLQRQMEQMAQSQQNGNSSSPSASSQSSNSQGAFGQSQSSADPRVRQAMDALRQAQDAMRRAGSPQQGNADARNAADRLRDAQNLMNGVQRQQSSGRLDSIARDADRLAATQREQSDQLRRLSQQNPSDNAQLQDAWGKMQAMAGDRQRLADDLSQLEKQMRDAARDLASTQPDAASKLRDAVGNTDSSDLQTRIQRSADWLRRGYSPNSESTESEIAKDLNRLGGDVRDAQRALGPGQSPQQQDSQTALDRVQRLKDQMEALTRGLGARNSQNRQQAQLGRDGQRGGQQGGQGGQQGGQQAGGQQAQQGQAGTGGAFGPGLDRNGGANARGFRDDGYYTGGQRYGGDGRGNWWIDTGNNSNLPGAVPPDRSQLPPDPELTYRQSVSNLNQLLSTFQNDPEEKRELQGLIQEMQRLDPKRFPGNPALLEQIHNQVLTEVNNLELQVQRKLGDQSGQIRSADPISVPAGYEDAVAEYFRRLSKTQ